MTKKEKRERGEKERILLLLLGLFFLSGGGVSAGVDDRRIQLFVCKACKQGDDEMVDAC